MKRKEKTNFMNKLFNKIAALSVGLAMAIGVGVAIGSQSKGVRSVNATDVTDIITASDLAATNTTYTDFSAVSLSSDAVYAGNSAKDSSGNIQLRSKNSNSGIVSTTSGGTVKSVKITVGSGSNTVDVYGSNTAYSAASDLYGTSKGTKVGSTSTTSTITFNADYEYVGIRSNNGAIYLSSVEIVWDGGQGGSTTYSVNYASATDVNVSGMPSADTGLSNGSHTLSNATPTRWGYTFGGWAATSGGTTQITSVTISDADVTVYAIWTADLTVTGAHASNPYTVAQARTAIDDGSHLDENYVAGKISQIDSYDSTYKSIQYWISDDGTTANQLEAYSGKGLNGADFNAVDDIEVGADVVICGTLKKYNSTYEFDKNNYQVSYTAPVITTTYDVTFDANGGGANPTTKQVGEGLTFVFPAPGSVSGKIFSGWSDDGTTFHQEGETSGAVNSDLDFVAYWQTEGTSADPYTVAEARTAIDANKGLVDAHVSGKISQIDSYNSTYKSIQYWISDDGTTTNQLEAYSGKGLNGADFSAKTDIEVGADVVICGTLKKYNSTYEFDKNNYQVSYTAPAPTPTISVSPTTLTLKAEGATGTITADTNNDGGATIVWTSDDPTVATVSGGTVTPVAEGTCTITAKITVSGVDYTATCAVTVGPAAIVIDSEGIYTLVEDESDLSQGDIVLITNADGSAAMSTTQNSNNRGKTNSGIENDEITISGETSIQVFMLEEYTVGNVDTFAFNTGSGYIYAAGASSNNYMRTTETINDNAKFAISIADGVASIVAQGTASRNTIFYNSQNAGVFSCYATKPQNTGEDVNIYKKTSAIDPTVPVSITLSSHSESIYVNGTVTLTASVNPSTAIPQTVTWLTSDATVATVVDGVVRGVAAGNATITAFADVNENGTLDSDEKSATCAVTVASGSDGQWVEVAITSLTSDDVFVIVADNGNTYAMSNNNGTSSAPSAVAVTVSEGIITSTVTDSIKWNVSVSDSSYTFYPDGDNENWLYCTNTNNGVRVGTNENSAFTLDAESGYLKHTGTSRYVGVYNSQDWRCYTSAGGNIANQTFKFYKFESNSSYTAADFATEFLATLSTGTGHVCAADGSTNLASLKAAWKTLAGKWDDVSDKTSITSDSVTPSESGNDYQKTKALYIYIAEKYNTQLQDEDLTDYNFMGLTGLTPRSNTRIAIFGTDSLDSTNLGAIAIVVTLISATALGGYFLLKKKKTK